LGIRALVPAMLVFTTTTVLISFMHINLFSFSQTSDVIWFGWFILATLVHAVMTIRAFQEKSAASA
jgi:hypothetical protein